MVPSQNAVLLPLLWVTISLMDCERCFPVHGPGCPASYTDAEGKKICVFCADSVPCPAQVRWIRRIQKEKSMNSCKQQGCSAKLSHNNRSGLCQAHDPRYAVANFQKKKPADVVAPQIQAAASSRNTNGADLAQPVAQAVEVAAVSKTNGHDPDLQTTGKTNGANGHDRGTPVAERVELILESIPVAEKVRMILAWIAGQT